MAADLSPDSSAAILVWENTWAERVAQAVVGSSGQVVAHERIPAEVVALAIAALEEA